MNDAQAKTNRQIGARIRQQREFLDYTREQLSEMADISTQFLADIELGRKSMTATTIIHLPKSLSVSTDYLLLGKRKGSDTENNAPSPIDLKEQILLSIEPLTPTEERGSINILKAYVSALNEIKKEN